MRRQPRSVAFLFVVSALIPMALAGCGGPSSPSDAGVVLQGRVVGAQAATTAVAARAGTGRTAVETITVTVAEMPEITTTVGADGTFTLRGLPEGDFTLVFSSGGTTVGTVEFDEVKPNQEITVTVRVEPTGVVVLEERRNGIGHGDLELEGLVTEVLALVPTGESRFVIDDHTVVARLGQTAIREGESRRSVEDVTVGRRVHVKGVYLPVENADQPVLAHEIKLQDDDDDDGDDEDAPRTCIISGGQVGRGIELEGNVMSGDSAGFVMRVQGNRASAPVDVQAAGATFKCNGPGSPTVADCQARVVGGAKIHVSGTLQQCTTTAALVRASRVMVQK
jgi:uncharacterized protein YndB with AHSA1/START domain